MRARHPLWRQRFSAELIARRDQPFVWGWADCCLTGADLARAICGVDHAAPLRGYDTPEGAARRLMRLGFKSVIEFVESREGLVRVARPTAGDPVIFPSAPLDLVAIADGRGSAWAQGERGLVLLPIPARGALFWSYG